ncbi:hypothetical protein PUN28_018510 [Cardiocondyla obscurior]|uniref:Uncharacterized protein n=1 Tax=Cardiocondyla obscurior TaxID=286306 RepID=A0AAW2EK22_9HYME
MINNAGPIRYTPRYKRNTCARIANRRSATWSAIGGGERNGETGKGGSGGHHGSSAGREYHRHENISSRNVRGCTCGEGKTERVAEPIVYQA